MAIADYLQQLRAREALKLAQLRERRPVRRRTEYADLPEFEAMRSTGRARLDKFERALAYLFEHGGVRLGRLQHKLMHAVRMAALKRMFGDELLLHLDYLRARYGIKEIYENVVILFPRHATLFFAPSRVPPLSLTMAGLPFPPVAQARPSFKRSPRH